MRTVCALDPGDKVGIRTAIYREAVLEPEQLSVILNVLYGGKLQSQSWFRGIKTKVTSGDLLGAFEFTAQDASEF